MLTEVNDSYDVASQWPGIKVVAEQTANWEVEQGYNVFQNILQVNPDLKVGLCEQRQHGLGAYRAIKEAAKDVIVIGYDAISAAL